MTRRWLLLMMAVLILFCCGPKEEKESIWKGTITEKDGVVIVHSPKEPAFGPEALVLEEDLVIGAGDEGEEEYMFYSAPTITVDPEGRIYALDLKKYSIRVYDPQGKYLFSFGGMGQGPGEIDSPSFIFFTGNDEIALSDSARSQLKYYSPAGEYLRAAKLPVSMFVAAMHNSGDIIGTRIKDIGESAHTRNGIINEVVRSKPPYEKIEPIGEYVYPKDPPGFSPPFAFYSDGRSVWGTRAEYELRINPPGKAVSCIISRDFDPVPLEPYIEKTITGGTQGIRFRKYFDPVYRIYCGDKNFLYAAHINDDPAIAKKAMIDVFDGKGRYIAEFEIPGEEMEDLCIRGNHLYTVESDALGYSYIKRYKMTWVDEVMEFVK